MEKSLAPLFIWKILKEYSDADHPITQQNIIDELEKYDIQMERKAVARHLLNLESCGYAIERTKKGVYLCNDGFEDSELRLLIDSVLFSKHISERYAQEIIEKLKSLGNVSFRKNCKSAYRVNTIFREKNSDYFFKIDEIGKAIESQKKVSFSYNEYGIDKKLHVILGEVVIDPFQLIAANNHYYLVGKNEKTKETQSFRIEKITDFRILDIPCDKANGRGDDLNKYINEHPYMYSGKSELIVLKIADKAIGEVVDAFADFSVIQKVGDSSIIKLNASVADVYDWAKRFGDVAEIIIPQELRNKLRNYCTNSFNLYCSTEDDRYDYIINKDENDLLSLVDIDLTNRKEYKESVDKKVVILKNNDLSDVAFLADFAQLEYLEIENNPIGDLSFLKRNKKISELVVKNTDIADFSFVKDLPSLKRLTLAENINGNYDAIYDLFDLELLTLTPEDAVKLDAVRLKRSCPKLQIKIIGIKGGGIRFLEAYDLEKHGVDLDKLKEIDAMFYVHPRNKCEFFDKSRIEWLLEYAKTKGSFTEQMLRIKLQSLMRIESEKSQECARAAIEWLVQSKYVCKHDYGWYDYMAD